ncbi:MAG TPA: protein kinase [Gemmatimonadaceae bacterium]|nr:protein kinase [Gemmatimonadaceae bacterium]
MPETQIPDIGKYKIVELVGEGAMGVVYRARDTVLDRSVAIKVMNESIARQDDLRRRFLHEAQAAASLQHPNVVTIYDLGDVEGHLFIAMEFVEGIDLEKLMDSGQPLSLQAKLDIMIDVLTGLSFAHKRGIVHRDIKPANIRVTEDGRAKIMDFGVAHLASSSMTTTGSLLGTPTYMAPEQITEGRTTEQTDLFAVGGVMYQLLTNLKPFEGPTLQNLFFRIITEEPKRVSELMPNLPRALDAIVAKSMAKDPKDRYGSALEMANELSAVRAKLSGPAYPESVSLSASVSSAIEQARKKAHARSKNFAIAGVSVLAAVILFIVWSEAGKSRADNSPIATAPAAGRDSVISAPAASVPTTSAQPPATEATVTKALPTPNSLPPAPKPEKSTAAARNTRTTTPPPKPQPKPPAKTVVRQSAPAINPPSPSTQTATQSVAAPVVTTTPTQQQPVTQRVVDPPKETPPTPTPPKAATVGDLSPVVESYARALESKDMGAVRRIYPGISGAQQRNLQAFFQIARDLNVTFRIEDLSSNATSAEATLAGTYDYVNTTTNDQKHVPVSFAASFQRDGNVWRLTGLR